MAFFISDFGFGHLRLFGVWDLALRILKVMEGFLSKFLDLLLGFWWVLLPFLLLPLLSRLRNEIQLLEREQEIEWCLLEIKIPKQLEKSPRAMEQVLTGLRGIGEGGRLGLEIVGINGAPHFFIRVPTEFVDTVETQIYSQYPKVEIFEVQDYTQAIGEDFAQQSYQLTGAEIVLAESDVYPIRTYRDFPLEEESEEARKIDPLSALTEIAGDIEGSEQLWVQCVISPTSGFEDDVKNEIDKLAGRSKEAPPFLVQLRKELLEVVKSLFSLTSGGGESGGSQAEGKELLDTEKALMKKMAENAAKQAFKTTIRFIYLAKEGDFRKGRPAALLGHFAQYNLYGSNRLEFDKSTVPQEGRIFGSAAKLRQARRLLFRYKTCQFGPGSFRLSSEALASLYHFPGRTVAVPTLERVQALKVQPPANLPTVQKA